MNDPVHPAPDHPSGSWPESEGADRRSAAVAVMVPGGIASFALYGSVVAAMHQAAR